MNELSPSLNISIQLLSRKAKIPARKSTHGAGWDIYCLNDCIVQARSRLIVGTGIAVAIPEGYYGHLFGRSGLAANDGIDVLGGVIDSDYRGEIHVILFNTTITAREFKSGDRIAQMIFMPHYHARWEHVETLPDSERGTGGLGSTGR